MSMNMKTFTVQIDNKLDMLIDELRETLGVKTKAETFRLAIALLKIAVMAKEQNLKIVTADSNNKIKQEIVLPFLSL